ncbi:MAG: hypothetical protein JSR15_07850 [Proteobacteria bacterium]|nr:hypothetical protein [Pseudomonadota bacterium]
MNELNFKPATGGGSAGDKTVSVPALDTGAIIAGAVRGSAQIRHQRRRLNVLRFTPDSAFRPFRVY